MRSAPPNGTPKKPKFAIRRAMAPRLSGDRNWWQITSGGHMRRGTYFQAVLLVANR